MKNVATKLLADFLRCSTPRNGRKIYERLNGRLTRRDAKEPEVLDVLQKTKAHVHERIFTMICVEPEAATTIIRRIIAIP